MNLILNSQQQLCHIIDSKIPTLLGTYSEDQVVRTQIRESGMKWNFKRDPIDILAINVFERAKEYAP